MTRQSAPLFYHLLGDLSDVPDEYIRDVSHMKRFLERWTMDPKYQEAFARDPEAALTDLGIELTPAEVIPLMDREAAMEATRLVRAGRAGEVPPAVLRYRYFIHEKIEHRRRQRSETIPGDPRLRAWRERMINRCIGELGQERADQIVHAPAALELSKGCTVGCWFCGVAAPKFDSTLPYTEENGQLWRDCLGVLAEVYGISARSAFLYWATDPLDNPDYEHFLADFYDVFGVCPQTTTAQGQKDIERTRRILQLAHSLNSAVDRFSIIALNSLYRVHEGFTPEELLRVECVPQNKESAEGGQIRKSNAGRARKFAKKRSAELVSQEQSSTIACVSGFLFNMVERTVKLISPCNASDRWPLGYWVIAQGTFDTADELRPLMRSMIDETIRDSLGVLDTVRLRSDVRIVFGPDRLRVASMGLGLAFENQPQAAELAELLDAGTYTVEQIALRRRETAGVSPAQTLAVLDRLFLGGFFDEEPPAPPVPESTAPEDNGLLQLMAAGRSAG